MADTSLRERVLAGETVAGILLTSGSPTFAELCARIGFDWVMADLEHGTGTEADLLGQLQAIQGQGVTALVRVESATRIRIGRALDLGADGVMVPRLESLAKAERVVSWLRYPPAGERGIALSTRGAGMGATPHAGVPAINDRVLGIVQIENPGALEAAAAMAALGGIDVLFIGPTDLSHALGVPGDLDHQRYRDAVRTVSRACEGQGTAAGVLVWSVDDVPRYLDEGFRFFALSADGSLLRAAARRALDSFRESVAGR